MGSSSCGARCDSDERPRLAALIAAGTHDYVIHLARGALPPARYFWSPTAYDRHAANWLPTRASGNFEVTPRPYGPRASALDGMYKLAPIARQG